MSQTPTTRLESQARAYNKAREAIRDYLILYGVHIDRANKEAIATLDEDLDFIIEAERNIR